MRPPELRVCPPRLSRKNLPLFHCSIRKRTARRIGKRLFSPRSQTGGSKEAPRCPPDASASPAQTQFFRRRCPAGFTGRHNPRQADGALPIPAEHAVGLAQARKPFIASLLPSAGDFSYCSRINLGRTQNCQQFIFPLQQLSSHFKFKYAVHILGMPQRAAV